MPHGPKFIVFAVSACLAACSAATSTSTSGQSGNFSDETGCAHTLANPVKVAGSITNIPEFHDCQALINHNRRSYGPIVGAYVWEKINSLGEPNVPLDPCRRAGAGPVYRSEMNTHMKVSQLRAVSDSALQATLSSSDLVNVSSSTIVDYRPLISKADVSQSQCIADFWSHFDGDTTTAYTVIELVNFSRMSYAPLHIGLGFSCVYLDATYRRAWLVNLGNDDAECSGRRVWQILQDFPSSDVLELHAHRLRPSLRAEDYPPVARWDWDPADSTQYLGVKCGAGWCEIGLPGLVSSPPFDLVLQQTSEKSQRVYRIKGWYDQQYLAVPEKPGSSSYRPGSVMGTLVPTLELARHNDPGSNGHAYDQGAKVTRVYLSSADDFYKDKMNFNFTHVSRPAAEITMYRFNLDNQKLAAIIQNASRRIERLVRYCDLNRKDIPATARWRWRSDDETTWNACLQGCCEVSGPQ